jgi:hypothetical protein
MSRNTLAPVQGDPETQRADYQRKHACQYNSSFLHFVFAPGPLGARPSLSAGSDRKDRQTPVCTENFILVAYVTESPNVSGDDRSVRPLPGPVRLAVQVEEPT